MSKERGRGRSRYVFSPMPQTEEVEEFSEQKGSDNNERKPQKRIEFSCGKVPEEFRGGVEMDVVA